MSSADPAGSLGPRAQRSARRRREILDAAARTIGERGYGGASLAAIAEDVGIAAPSLLHHFRNKEHLLTEVLAYRDDLSRSYHGQDAVLEGAPLLEHLVDTAAENSHRRGLTQLYAVLLGESITTNHPGKDFFRDRFVGLRTMVRDAVLEAIADPAVGEADVLETASAIIAVMDGIQFQFLLEPDAVDMAGVTERTIRALLADLRAGGAGGEGR